jgi:hypothetical protein
MTDILGRLREAFDGDSIAKKNIALRKAFDEIEGLRQELGTKCQKPVAWIDPVSLKLLGEQNLTTTNIFAHEHSDYVPVYATAQWRDIERTGEDLAQMSAANGCGRRAKSDTSGTAALTQSRSNGVVKSEDIDKMVAALAAFRGYEWWFQTENPNPESRCLSPLVLQNMKLGYENGTLEPSMMQFKNLLATAMFYQQKSRSAALPTHQRTGGVPDDATPEMVEAALAVEWQSEDERGTVHNIWHAMCAAAPSVPGSGWLPINTAPKDHTEVLVGWWHYPDPDLPETHLNEYGSYQADPNVDLTKPRWVWCKSSYGDYGHRRGFAHRNGAHEATHWLPLSAPPSSGTANHD